MTIMLENRGHIADSDKISKIMFRDFVGSSNDLWTILITKQNVLPRTYKELYL